ncbi:unnamed protein product [Acanthoscelides obtectus]|uniref:Uncharacterized protein n=1 Tax=Acanthoscelides obtectus TaxID=200917 RepID=A0A9P0Q3J0_ACAOB|nr:unnamed protein product [Acanthoscelides obtectus]CAK1665546.1 hypothetical protein AOBTE_LOCUS24874 [Acanthoscelides obtectus]
MSLKIQIPVNLLLLPGGYPREYKQHLILLPYAFEDMLPFYEYGSLCTCIALLKVHLRFSPCMVT